MRKQIVTITLVFCVALLLTSCSGYVRVDIRPTLRGTVAVGPVGQDRCFPVQYANVYTSDGYRRYDAYYAYSADEYRFPSLTPGYYDVEVETLLGSRSIPLHYPTDYYFHQNWLPPGYRDDHFAQLGGMYFTFDGSSYEEKPLTRWPYGTVYVYIDPSLSAQTISGILSDWQTTVFSYGQTIGPCTSFSRVYNRSSANIIFEYDPYLAWSVWLDINHDGRYLEQVTVTFDHNRPSTAICSYAIAQAMGMGTSPDIYSVLYWKSTSNQRSELNSYEKNYARIMYSIEPGLEMTLPRQTYSFLQIDGFPASIDFEMGQNSPGGTVQFGKGN
ncbi:MAG: hypothetical protein M0Q40_08385 [Limnochordia bacterium]|nr:hypothetical protein [Limnochordia bacterium]